MSRKTSRETSTATADTARPQPGVLAVVWHNGQVLLVRRRNPPQAGHWGFPGGRVEPGETLRDAARRELLEETGVSARAGVPFTALDVLDRDGTGGLRFHYVLVAVPLTFLAGAARPGDDALETGWFPPGTLPEPLCADVQWLVETSRAL